MKTTLFLPLALAAALCAVASAGNLSAQPAAAVTAADATNNIADPASQDLVRAYLQIQEQLHATQLALERNRLAAEESAASNAIALAARLDDIEKNFEAQRVRETRAMLTVAGVIIGCGLLAMFLVSYLQLRAMNRFAEVALGLPVNQLNQLAAGGSAGHLLGNGAAEAGTRLTATIERLEKRIRELESGAPALPPAAAPAAGGVDDGDTAGRIETLLAKGQLLLARDQAAAADAAFDAALALDPKHVEALIKKGAALEKLLKLDEAIACYDRVIAADSTVTIAHIYKGGVFNRLERYPEALACYEQALKTQEKARAA